MDADQRFVPDSFCALYRDARGRFLVTRDELLVRYEFCEDLAQHLSEEALRLVASSLPDEAAVLARIAAGLRDPASGLSAGEGGWVVQRLAELLNWPGAGELTPTH